MDRGTIGTPRCTAHSQKEKTAEKIEKREDVLVGGRGGEPKCLQNRQIFCSVRVICGTLDRRRSELMEKESAKGATAKRREGQYNLGVSRIFFEIFIFVSRN